MTEWQLTEEAFNLFLSWLDNDQETAGKKYEGIRHRLIVMFDSRGCAQSEDLADETINRFIRRLPAIIDSIKDPIPYLHVVASNLYLEYIQKQSLPLPENHSEKTLSADDDNTERVHECLDKCLSKLESKDRALVLDYYQKDKQAKIDFRKELARRWGLTANALRIKVHNIRTALHKCINDCLEPVAAEMK
jgi:DNA-directed RNA polymerase specialized sigma24 family protein